MDNRQAVGTATASPLSNKMAKLSEHAQKMTYRHPDFRLRTFSCITS